MVSPGLFRPFNRRTSALVTPFLRLIFVFLGETVEGREGRGEVP